jgi:cell division protein FtsN
LNDGTASSDASKPGSGGEERRPDKTTAIASRLIAAAIGQQPAQRTKEQREYDQAMKVQEKKKRDQAKDKELQAQREKEQAKKDIWGD